MTIIIWQCGPRVHKKIPCLAIITDAVLNMHEDSEIILE